jgi:hypothetical protein
MDTIPADKLVKAYIKLRDARAVLKSEYEAQDAVLLDKVATIESKLLDFCRESGADGVKTPFGTASRVVKERYFTNDWSSFRAFVKEHDAFDLFEKRIHQGAIKEFLESNPDLRPEGLNVHREYAVVVRKAK